MDDQDKIDVTDTDVLYDHLTSKNRLLMEEITEDEGTTALHRYQPPRVSWTQRVLGWFRRN
jgi:hypothetical protein